MDISEEKYDFIVDTQIKVDVTLGGASITIKEFLNFSEGDILVLDKNAGDGGDIYVNERIIGTGDIIVMEDKLAVRVQDTMDSDNVVRYFFEEKML